MFQSGFWITITSFIVQDGWSMVWMTWGRLVNVHTIFVFFLVFIFRMNYSWLWWDAVQYINEGSMKGLGFKWLTFLSCCGNFSGLGQSWGYWGYCEIRSWKLHKENRIKNQTVFNLLWWLVCLLSRGDRPFTIAGRGCTHLSCCQSNMNIRMKLCIRMTHMQLYVHLSLIFWLLDVPHQQRKHTKS